MSNKSIRWKELCDEYRESGLTQSEFCRRKGISVGSFQYQWRRQREHAVKMDGVEMVSAGCGFESIGLVGELSPEPMPGKISVHMAFENGIFCDFEIPAAGLSGFLETVRSL